MTKSLKKAALLACAFMLTVMSVNAQTYINISGGPSFKAGETKLTNTGTLKGSYGEGVQFHARVGKYITDKLAIEFGAGYLQGKDQTIREIEQLGFKVTGAARAYGAALTARYDVAAGLYARAGVLSKLGGKTAIVGGVDTELSAGLLNPQAPAGAMAPVKINVERDNKGKFPLGFTAGLGYQVNVTDNIGFFVEGVFDNIKVPGKESIRTAYSASIGGVDTSAAQLQQLLPLLVAKNVITEDVQRQLSLLVSEEFKYGEEGVGEFDSPYSSISVMVGASFNF